MYRNTDDGINIKLFQKRKREILASIYSNEVLNGLVSSTVGNNSNKIDRSLKESVDAKLSVVCLTLNSHQDYYTTSTCSGRIHVFRQVKTEDFSYNQKIKHSGYTVFYAHDAEEVISTCELLDRIANNSTHFATNVCKQQNISSKIDEMSEKIQCQTSLMFEPLLLQVQCVSFSAAMRLVKSCREAGIKNCGIFGYNKNKGYLVTINGSDRLSIPIETYEDGIIAEQKQLDCWLNLAKKLLTKNEMRIQLLLKALINLSAKNLEKSS